MALVLLSILQSALESTSFHISGNHPELLFLILAGGFAGGFAIAARIQWRGQELPAQDDQYTPIDPATVEIDPLFANLDKSQLAPVVAKGNASQAPSRPIADTVGCAGWGSGAALGFVAVFVLELNGIVNNDLWFIVGPLVGTIIGSAIAALVLRRLRSAPRDAV